MDGRALTRVPFQGSEGPLLAPVERLAASKATLHATGLVGEVRTRCRNPTARGLLLHPLVRKCGAAKGTERRGVVTYNVINDDIKNTAEVQW